MTASLDIVDAALGSWLSDARRPFVLGICGAQGSGKSTLSEGLAQRLEGRGLKAAVLSLDDLYLSRDARTELADTVHPLFRTRGVPGTHDVALGLGVLDQLTTGPARLPRFDKATDDPVETALWPEVENLDVLIFEGWCVGAIAQPVDDLATPINDLERTEDPDGVWRRHVNDALASSYAPLFARIDRLVLLAAPGFEVVQAWRTQQEHHLSRMLESAGRTGTKVMSDAQIVHFIQHYERLTRYILSEMPDRADLTLRLDANRGLS